MVRKERKLDVVFSVEERRGKETHRQDLSSDPEHRKVTVVSRIGIKTKEQTQDVKGVSAFLVLIPVLRISFVEFNNKK